MSKVTHTEEAFKMNRIIRKGIAFEPRQLREFDKLIKARGYKNRSEAVRDLIRAALIKEEQQNPEAEMIATLTIVYNHSDHDLQHALTHAQHQVSYLVISSMHTHLDKNNCLEVLVMKGKISSIKQLADKLIATKGVKHGKLVVTAVS